MLDKMKALWDMQRKAQEIKRQLEDIAFEVESLGKEVRITMNGSQEVKDIKIIRGLVESERAAFEVALKDVFNKAIRRSHEIAAEKMKGIVGLDLAGLI